MIWTIIAIKSIVVFSKRERLTINLFDNKVHIDLHSSQP